jgi:hypothetical protein
VLKENKKGFRKEALFYKAKTPEAVTLLGGQIPLLKQKKGLSHCRSALLVFSISPFESFQGTMVLIL